MCTQQQIVINKESVLHVACGMFRRKVERLEIVPVVLNLRSLSNRKTQAGEDVADFLGNQGDRVLGTANVPTTRKCYIDSFRL